MRIKKKFFFLQPEVPFLGADENDPLVLTGRRVANFFISSNFDQIFFTNDTQNGPETESVKNIHLAPPPPPPQLPTACICWVGVYLAAYCLYVWGVYLAACCLYVLGVYLAADRRDVRGVQYA